MEQQVRITSKGIKKALNEYSQEKAISQYIWNGFDARASKVELIYKADQTGWGRSIIVSDNGTGIDKNLLSTKFSPLFQSEKELTENLKKPTTSTHHGKNGVGRLTFFRFAKEAIWETTYKKGDKNFKYNIEVKDASLNTYSTTDEVETTDETGTNVYLNDVAELNSFFLELTLLPFLKREFCWFLELNNGKGFSLKINGEELDYQDLIGDTDNFTIMADFEVRYIRWNDFLSEYSQFYFIDSHNKERHKDTTSLNNKGDNFFHSVYVKSDFFDLFTSYTKLNAPEPKRPEQLARLFEVEAVKQPIDTYRKLREELNNYLVVKRKPFVTDANDLINDLKKTGAFPKYGDDLWHRHKEKELEEVVSEFYKVQPKVFNKLNVEQQKALIGLLALVMDSNERDNILKIVDSIVNLNPIERARFRHLLELTTMSNILATIKLIEDRFQVVKDLEALVFDSEKRANERDNLQKTVESHYWLFGEQYHLVAAAERPFEEVLRRHIFELTGENKTQRIDDPDKRKELDILMVRQSYNSGDKEIKNIVVELKHPDIRLGHEEQHQVETYHRVILKQPQLNQESFEWEFYLIGNDYDTSGDIKRAKENARNHGEPHLIYSVGNCKIYVKTWGEVFNEVKLKHKFLRDKLQLQLDKMDVSGDTADEITQHLTHDNSAKQPSELEMPRKPKR